MERIKEALEKAGKSRDRVENLAPEKKPSPIYSDSKSGNGYHAAEEFGYTHTRESAVDHGHLERNRIVAHNKNNLNSNTFDLLRTQVLKKMQENNWRTLAVVSPTAEAGKTVVCINLAISIARHAEKSALLVDFDLRRPSVAKYLGLKQEFSLNEMLEGRCALEDCLVSPQIPRFTVLAAQRPMEHSAEILASSKVGEMIKELRDRYAERIVIFDLPPLLNADDAMAVLSQIDCSLMVIANGMSSRREIEDGLRYLPKTNLLGTVLNKGLGGSDLYAYKY